jgi:hypothetical protein
MNNQIKHADIIKLPLLYYCLPFHKTIPFRTTDLTGNYCHLGCVAMKYDRKIPTFRITLLPLTSGQKSGLFYPEDGGSKFLYNVS